MFIVVMATYSVVHGTSQCAYVYADDSSDDMSDDIRDDDSCEQTPVDNSGVLTKYMKVTSPDIMGQSIGRYGDNGQGSFTVTWVAPSMVKKVNILYTVDDGKTYVEIAAGVDNTGSYVWNLPEINSDHVKVRVSGIGADGYNYGSDLSNAFFTVKNAA